MGKNAHTKNFPFMQAFFNFMDYETYQSKGRMRYLSLQCTYIFIYHTLKFMAFRFGHENELCFYKGNKLMDSIAAHI